MLFINNKKMLKYLFEEEEKRQTSLNKLQVSKHFSSQVNLKKN